METPLVLTIIGPDRPGLVDSLATLIADHGGNWLESRMSHLGGRFAGIVRIVLPEGRMGDFRSALEGLKGRTGLEIIAQDSGGHEQTACVEIAEVEIVGQDRPGIVSHISRAFAKHGVNVEELESECRNAPMSGEQLFEARARVCIPQSCDVAALRADLEKIASDLMVDLSFDVEARVLPES